MRILRGLRMKAMLSLIGDGRMAEHDSPKQPSLLGHARTPGGGFDLHDNANPHELFLDGVGQIQLGSQVCKLKFYTVKSARMENNVLIEDRIISHVMTLPTSAILDLTNSLIDNIIKGKDLLSKSAQNFEAGVSNLANRVKS
jgi:hypothetical protein